MMFASVGNEGDTFYVVATSSTLQRMVSGFKLQRKGLFVSQSTIQKCSDPDRFCGGQSMLQLLEVSWVNCDLEASALRFALDQHGSTLLYQIRAMKQAKEWGSMCLLFGRV